MTALETQVGGDHYKKLGAYQPWEVLARCMTPDELRGFAKGTMIAAPPPDLAAEVERLRELFSQYRFVTSKDWRESDLVGRAEWLIESYRSAKSEVERLQDEVNRLAAERDKLINAHAIRSLSSAPATLNYPCGSLGEEVAA